MSWHHRFQGCFIDNKWMWPILRRVADLKLVPFVHASAESNLESPWRLQRLALEFPEITFVALDAFFSYERTQEVMHLAERTPNIIWDAGAVQNLCRTMGSTPWFGTPCVQPGSLLMREGACLGVPSC